MNQGKSEVVKQEMARVNIDILGISKLKWIGMGEFNSDDRYIYYCGQESLRRNGAAIMVNRVQNAVPGSSTWGFLFWKIQDALWLTLIFLYLSKSMIKNNLGQEVWTEYT